MCPTVLQFRIDMEGTKPLQWRRIRVCDKMTVIGFINYVHLLFNLKTLPQDRKVPIKFNSKQDKVLEVDVKKRLKNFNLQPGTKIVWEDNIKKTRLSVKIEAILMLEAGVSYPICLKRSYRSFYRKNEGLEQRFLNNL